MTVAMNDKINNTDQQLHRVVSDALTPVPLTDAEIESFFESELFSLNMDIGDSFSFSPQVLQVSSGAVSPVKTNWLNYLLPCSPTSGHLVVKRWSVGVRKWVN